MTTTMNQLGPTLLRVAWLSVGLGIAMQALLLAITLGLGRAVSAAGVNADVVQGVTWAMIVCVGLAIGTTASKVSPAAGGLAGLLAAPLGFTVARALQKGVAEALGVYATAGLVAGIAFGGLILYLASPMPPPALVRRGLNELLFPVGCSLVLYSAEAVGRLGAGRQPATA